ncbi:MAG: flavodoxin family protein [Candidatus Eisenbacteria bacterium]
MKKLLGISASKRPWGNCETSIKTILASAAEEGARTDFVRLTDFRIEACLGCFKCLVEDTVCPLEDDLYTLLEAVGSADALALAGPVYFLMPPAVLVALLDRLLTMKGRESSAAAPRPAVTLAIMGNHNWRGVARPVINMTASLLGFEVVESMHLVAEGPGEVLMDDRVAGHLDEVGRKLAHGTPVPESKRSAACPICASDFFRIEPPNIVCPICGSVGDLEVYAGEGKFLATGDEPRWGLSWLDKHVESWIEPSLRRYKGRRKQVLSRLKELKARYTAGQGKG